MEKTPNLTIKYFEGLQDYALIWQAMKDYTDTRTENSADEIWVLQHPPVFTQGQNGKPEHILNPGNIPVIQVDRGGQVTYHGPGQLVAYVLVDLKRRNLGVRDLVRALEQAIINVLAEYHICAKNRTDAPGVYVNEAKIASLGLRVRRGCSYHGLAFNIDMDMKPFTQINPCGLMGIRMVQLQELINDVSIKDVEKKLVSQLNNVLQQEGR
ncbi:MAG: lipoyl(octanoyl) transferase LipB [Legionellales bacterium]|nr:lipoyl(octanoyl) transferase LipB [Legionellales bacterium]